MIEEVSDLWDPKWDLRCITTNGFVKKNGRAVMGAGVALQVTCKQKYNGIEESLGRLILEYGNNVYHVMYDIISFPVKHNWWEKANLDLIEKSAWQLVDLINKTFPEAKLIALPRPGCGNGKLNWEDVKPVISFLDDRFYVITKSRHFGHKV